MRARSAAALVGLFALSLGACDNDELPPILPIAEAQASRELRLLTVPPVVTVTRDTYTDAQSKQGEEAAARNERYLRDTYGRVGFFSNDYDLRPVGGQTSALFVAFYSSDDKTITLIGAPERSVVVHELVHAIQDQNFDLTRIEQSSTSTDESAAKSALIEGDATIAEDRYILTARGQDYRDLGAFLTFFEASRESEDVLAKSRNIAPFFASYAAFNYSYGAAYVERLLGSGGYAALDASFMRGGPSTTLTVLFPVPDVATPVGLTRLPSSVVAFYAIDTVDRLGAWYSYLLLRPAAPGASPDAIVAGWKGDQLAIVHRRDTRIGTPNGQSGTIWTSLWSDPTTAADIARLLSQIHGLSPTSSEIPETFRARDGEDVWLERRGSLLTFVKNVALDDARVFADRALSTPKEQATLPIRRQVIERPHVFPCALGSRGRGVPR